MKIAGIQKLTLLDFPGEVACTVFTAGCTLRCPFCHNPGLVIKERFPKYYINDDVFFVFLRKRKGKISGVVISGGEPLLQPDIVPFIKKVHDMGFKVKLDTNGTFPEKLETLLKSGLVDYVAVDIKSALQKYSRTCGIDGDEALKLPEFIKKSVTVLMESGIPYEFRTTVARGFIDEADIRGIGELIRGADAWYLQQFINDGDLVGTGEGLSSPSKEQLESYLSIAQEYVPNVKLRGV